MSLKMPSSLSVSDSVSMITEEDFPDFVSSDPLSSSMEMAQEKPDSLSESTSSSSSTEETALEGYETISFLPVSSDVMDLVNNYKHLVRKLDHYPRGEDRSELIASIFREIGELISYGHNDMTSDNSYYELRDAVDVWMKKPVVASCASSCALL